MKLDWYFDFISPFAYLQFAAHPDLMARDDVTLRPMVFAGLLAHWGHKGPAEIPEKRKQTFRGLVWQTGRRGIAFRAPPAHPFNPIHVLRLAVALGAGVEVVRAIFEFIWRDGRSPADEWPALCERLGVRDADALLADASVKARLRGNGEAAIAAGVYGVPTFVVHDARPGSRELFWGEDATPMLRAYLADPALFDAPEMRRMVELPAAAVRREAMP